MAHALALLPFALLVRGVVVDDLGADPVARITHDTGTWALRLLLLGLALTPLRRIIGQAWPIRFRRLVGLYAFFYACLHLATWLVLDLGGYWTQVFDDLAKRPYIMLGFAAWLSLLPLALTSTRGWMRRLGRRWGQLHRLVYVAAGLAVAHYLWLVKADLREPLVYAAILALLLGLRVYWHLAKRRARSQGA
ncbi:MAG TPA: protein-methionine-sulfoxide reductase heme-binding subunit MsrQ [Arenimonas sp.]|nr:protein-methionine-sulfoxide reductase heme-binding subunit MsrQ [Arenimonas sp.]